MKKRDRFFLCTIIPMIVVFFLFHTFPLLKGVMYSFTNFRGFGDFDFIGLMNFKDLFTDSRVLNSYMFTFKFAIVTTIIVNLISLTLALALNSKIKFKFLFFTYSRINQVLFFDNIENLAQIFVCLPSSHRQVVQQIISAVARSGSRHFAVEVADKSECLPH